MFSPAARLDVADVLLESGYTAEYFAEAELPAEDKKRRRLNFSGAST